MLSCNQRPLFYDISLEYPPIDPVIGGAPSRIVKVNNNLFVSNNTVWQYMTGGSGQPVWVQMPVQPPSRIKTLAATDTALYALDWDGTVYECPTPASPSWTEKFNVQYAQQMFIVKAGAVYHMYLGTHRYTDRSVYGLYHWQVGDPSQPASMGLGDSVGLLLGVVYSGSSYYYGFMGNPGALYKGGTATSLGTVEISAGIRGMLDLGSDRFVTVGSDKFIRYFDGSGWTKEYPYDVEFSGALDVWDNGTAALLLIGLEYGSWTFSYGYREMTLTRRGTGDYQLSIADYSLYEPGNDVSNSGTTRVTSISPSTRYTAAIGNHPVKSIMTAPLSMSYKADAQGRPVIFASTLRNGLWSYRQHNSTPQWNGEDNGN